MLNIDWCLPAYTAVIAVAESIFGNGSATSNILFLVHTGDSAGFTNFGVTCSRYVLLPYIITPSQAFEGPKFTSVLNVPPSLGRLISFGWRGLRGWSLHIMCTSTFLSSHCVYYATFFSCGGYYTVITTKTQTVDMWTTCTYGPFGQCHSSTFKP